MPQSISAEWEEVEDTEHEREWHHADGHRLVIKKIKTEHTYPDEYVDYKYSVNLVVNATNEFILGGIEEKRLENAVEVAEEVLSL